MSDLLVINETCPLCDLPLLESDNYCSRCGTPAGVSLTVGQSTDLINQPRQCPAYAPQVVIVPQTQVSVVDEVLNNRAIIVAILLVAGPIGLPALWFSRRFSKRVKIVTTVAYFLLTAVLPLVALWYFLEISLRPLLNIFSGTLIFTYLG